jgi:hypothetical protein
MRNPPKVQSPNSVAGVVTSEMVENVVEVMETKGCVCGKCVVCAAGDACGCFNEGYVDGWREGYEQAKGEMVEAFEALRNRPTDDKA